MSDNLRDAIVERSQAAAAKDRQRREQELRDFAVDPAMESLETRLAEMRRDNPRVVIPIARSIDAYTAKKTAAAVFKATGELPAQIVSTHRPGNDAA
jgi:hypothetical protein